MKTMKTQLIIIIMHSLLYQIHTIIQIKKKKNSSSSSSNNSTCKKKKFNKLLELITTSIHMIHKTRFYWRMKNKKQIQNRKNRVKKVLQKSINIGQNNTFHYWKWKEENLDVNIKYLTRNKMMMVRLYTLTSSIYKNNVVNLN